MTLGEAIRLAYGKNSQTRVAELLGTTQGRVSKWARDETQPSLDEITALEVAVGRPVGFVLRAAGHVADSTSIPDAIRADPGISEEARALLLALYEHAASRGPNPTWTPS